MTVFDDVMRGAASTNELYQHFNDQRKRNSLAQLTGQYAAGEQVDPRAFALAGGNPLDLRDDQQKQQTIQHATLGRDVQMFLTNPSPEGYEQLKPRLKAVFPQTPEMFDPAHAEGLAKVGQLLGGGGAQAQQEPADVQTLQYLSQHPEAMDTFKTMKVAGRAPPGWRMGNIPDPDNPDNVIPVMMNGTEIRTLDGTTLYGGQSSSAPPTGKTVANDGSPVVIDSTVSPTDRAAILANPQSLDIRNPTAGTAPLPTVQGPPIVGSANSTPPPGLMLPARSAPTIPGNIPGSHPRFKPTAQIGDDADASTIADAIVSGRQPPVLSGLYRHGAAVRSKLEKRGYNLTLGMQDWLATQRLYQTLNGTQQTRLREAVGMVKESVPLLRGLISEWDAGGFPVLNKARLELAKQGVMGQKAQSIATRLDQQIADMTGEMGTIIMGGNSPTDHGLELAGKQFSGNWTKQTALDALVQTEQNIQYRENSLNNLGTSGITESQFNQTNPTESLGQGGTVRPGLTPNASDAARGGPNEQHITNAAGDIMVVRNGKWVKWTP